jgi:hypothetical protein
MLNAAAKALLNASFLALKSSGVLFNEKAMSTDTA